MNVNVCICVQWNMSIHDIQNVLSQMPNRFFQPFSDLHHLHQIFCYIKLSPPWVIEDSPKISQKCGKFQTRNDSRVIGLKNPSNPSCRQRKASTQVPNHTEGFFLWVEDHKTSFYVLLALLHPPYSMVEQQSRQRWYVFFRYNTILHPN